MKQWIVAGLTVLTVGCASGVDLSKLPPLKIDFPTEPVPVVAPAVEKATLAFQITDTRSGAPIESAFASIDGATEKQADVDGYIAFELPTGAVYTVVFEADDYETATRKYQLTANRQWAVKLTSLKVEPIVVVGVPVPPVAPVLIPSAPIVAPPVDAAPLISRGVVSVEQITAIAKRIHDAERWDLGGASSRETRNQFWARVVGVVHFGHPVFNLTADASWCLKDAGGGRPQSDDVAANCVTRRAWDFLPGVGGPGYRFEAHEVGVLSGEQNIYPPPPPDPLVRVR